MCVDGHRSLGNAVASIFYSHLAGEKPGSVWYLNRVKVDEKHQGKGLGSWMVKTLQEELLKKPGFRLLIVEPGGYGSSIKRLNKFYQAQGFVFSPCGRWLEWRPPHG